MSYLSDAAELIRSELSTELRPDEGADSLYRLYALLALVAGRACTLENVHDAWSTWMSERQPDHDALIPFMELRPDQQEQDRPYLEAVLRVARRLERS